MRTTILKFGWAILTVVVFHTALIAQDKEENTASMNDEQAAMMEAWNAYRTPGEMHEMLAGDAGEWNAEITHWADPSAPPEKAKGTEVCKMVMGGRYLKISFKGEIMGEPYNGTGVMGYDNAKKEFFATWIDDMGTGIMVTRGTPVSGEDNSMEMKGTMVDPMTGNDMKVREVVTRIDENHRKMEMFLEHGGKEMKTMEINYTRKE